MQIRVREITIGFDHKTEELRKAILNRLKIGSERLTDYTVVRKSIDARKKANIKAIYTVDVKIKNAKELLNKFSQDSKISQSPSLDYKIPDAKNYQGQRPVIIGSGPCGLFAALILAQAGVKPILVERGKEVGKRVRDVNNFWKSGKLDLESNAQFGEGGAGTFSDGKLTTQIKDRHNRVRKILEEFVKAGGPEEIFYLSKPHIGTNNLVKVVKNIRNEIISLGGEVRFETKLTNIETQDGKIKGVILNHDECIKTNVTVLAIGHSARDTFEMLQESGISITAKPFSIGVRIEHPQELINKSQFGKYAGNEILGAAEYKLVQHCSNNRSAYTFCMCPGGKVIGCSSEAGSVVTNGMSTYARNDSNANSALLVGVGPEDFESEDILAGVNFQRKWEKRAFEIGGGNYFAPAQLVGDFLNSKPSRKIGKVKPSYTPGVKLVDLSKCLPDFVTETLKEAIPAMDKKLRGFAMDEAIMTAVESRSSSPIRILRNENFQSLSTAGLYPGGEGAGYAGGIISAAVDGIKIAEAILANTK